MKLASAVSVVHSFRPCWACSCNYRYYSGILITVSNTTNSSSLTAAPSLLCTTHALLRSLSTHGHLQAQHGLRAQTRLSGRMQSKSLTADRERSADAAAVRHTHFHVPAPRSLCSLQQSECLSLQSPPTRLLTANINLWSLFHFRLLPHLHYRSTVQSLNIRAATNDYFHYRLFCWLLLQIVNKLFISWNVKKAVKRCILEPNVFKLLLLCKKRERGRHEISESKGLNMC